jgi:hypothetical protein
VLVRFRDDVESITFAVIDTECREPLVSRKILTVNRGIVCPRSTLPDG